MGEKGIILYSPTIWLCFSVSRIKQVELCYPSLRLELPIISSSLTYLLTPIIRFVRNPLIEDFSLSKEVRSSDWLYQFLCSEILLSFWINVIFLDLFLQIFCWFQLFIRDLCSGSFCLSIIVELTWFSQSQCAFFSRISISLGIVLSLSFCQSMFGKFVLPITASQSLSFFFLFASCIWLLPVVIDHMQYANDRSRFFQTHEENSSCRKFLIP